MGDLLAGKVAVVTGGANGIGRATVERFVEEGARVVVADLDTDAGEALTSSLGSATAFKQTDVSESDQVQALVDFTVERYGGLDALVHNATSRISNKVATIEDITQEAWNDHVAVSVRGAFLCATAALEPLRRSQGRLVVMTSPAAMEGSRTSPGYAAVKGALRGFAKSLAQEWGPLGVTVAAVSPLAMTPAMVGAYRENPALEARLRALVPMGRVGDPELDVAPVVRFLAEDASRYITGQTIIVDGGRFTTL